MAEAIFHDIDKLIVGNTSAKAAVETAVYDCLAQLCGLPCINCWADTDGRSRRILPSASMTRKKWGKTRPAMYRKGFARSKLRLEKRHGNRPRTDQEIRKQAGPAVRIRVDANQGWTAKQAVKAIRKMEDEGLSIELVEQPVHRLDLEGLKQVTDAVDTPIMADESVFTPRDAFHVLKTRSADLINIKLMKAGGIRQALKINAMGEACGVECMAGSMIETRLGITAAVHFAASQKNVTKFDFDAPLMLKEDIVEGGIRYHAGTITIPDAPGLGITKVCHEGRGQMSLYTTAVSVANVWTSPEAPRTIDRMMLSNPVHVRSWLDELSYEERLELCTANLVQTQVLFGEDVQLIKERGDWAFVIIPGQPSAKDKRGYPGWIPKDCLVEKPGEV